LSAKSHPYIIVGAEHANHALRVCLKMKIFLNLLCVVLFFKRNNSIWNKWVIVHTMDEMNK
jgi:hypothetical protein